MSVLCQSKLKKNAKTSFCDTETETAVMIYWVYVT